MELGANATSADLLAWEERLKVYQLGAYVPEFSKISRKLLHQRDFPSRSRVTVSLALRIPGCRPLVSRQ